MMEYFRTFMRINSNALAGVGSARGVALPAQAAMGVLSEDIIKIR